MTADEEFVVYLFRKMREYGRRMRERQERGDDGNHQAAYYHGHVAMCSEIMNEMALERI